MGSIIAYLSHSYRPEDRAINMEVWKRLNAAGVTFSVDKPSVDEPDKDRRPMDVTFLERMMRRAHCFVGIIPRRQAAAAAPPAPPSWRWSPYQALEFRLALRANKPRLVIIEQNMGRGPVPPDEPLLSFDRRPVFKLSSKFDEEVERLVQQAQTHDHEPGYMPPIGLLRWDTSHKAWHELVDAARDSLKEDCEVVDVSAETKDDDLLARARRVSVLVADLHPSVTPMHVIGLLHGAGIPLYRTCLVKSVQDIAQFSRDLGLADGNAGRLDAARVALPRLLHGYQVDERMQPVLYWTASEATKTGARIAEVTSSYHQRESMLEQYESGSKYFLALRGNRVFISTPGDMNELTLQVQKALKNDGMPAFHYKDDDDPLRAGRPWKEQIKAQVKEADLLLAFLSESFYARPECVDELVQAVRRWERHQMLLLAACVQFVKMPPFIGRLQASRVEPARVDRLVNEVKRLFKEGSGDWTEDTEKWLAEFVQKHVLGPHGLNLDTWLREQCHVADADAARLAGRAAGAPDQRARELVVGLWELVSVEGPRSAALARLVMFLRAQERDTAAAHDALGCLYSKLRLLPDLHDVNWWLEDRKRGQPLVVTLAPGVGAGLLPWVADAAGKQEDRLQAARDLGGDVAGCIKEGAALREKPFARVCVEGTAESLMAPVEWATFEGQPEPLGRRTPVSRRIKDLTPARARLEHAFHHNRTGPPRVLLFGSPSPDLPDVPQEMQAIEQCWTSRYDRSGWPRELVKTVISGDATSDNLRLLLTGGDHEILHLACHAGLDGNTPVLLLHDPTSGDRMSLPASAFREWLKNSMLRFVYLSCCEGAAHKLTARHVAGWRQSLCKEVLDAGVPEVVSYVWRVSDAGSVRFTLTFYERFVRDFDAAAALHEARRGSAREDPLWATAVLVQQTQADTP